MIRQGKQSQQECLCLFSHILIQDTPGFVKVWKTVSRVWLSHCLLNLPLAPISLSLPGVNLVISCSLVEPSWSNTKTPSAHAYSMFVNVLFPNCFSFLQLQHVLSEVHSPDPCPIILPVLFAFALCFHPPEGCLASGQEWMAVLLCFYSETWCPSFL